MGAPDRTRAPAYDINPVAAGNGHVLNIDEDSNAQDLNLAREVDFRLGAARVAVIIEEVKASVRTWPTEAAALEVTGESIPAPADTIACAVQCDEGITSACQRLTTWAPSLLDEQGHIAREVLQTACANGHAKACSTRATRQRLVKLVAT